MNAATAIKTIVRWVLVTLGIAQALGLLGDAQGAAPAGQPLYRISASAPG